MAVFLTTIELERLLDYSYKFTKDHTRNALLAFLIASYTGLTLQQILKLRYRHIHGDFITNDPESGLSPIYKQVPVKLLELIGEGSPEQRVLSPVSTKTINYSLLLVRSEIEVHKRITFYHARPTYINLLTQKSIQNENN